MARARSHRTLRVRQCTVEALAVLDFSVSLSLLVFLSWLFTQSSERNMYLAEDRILCFEIVTKKREGWM